MKKWWILIGVGILLLSSAVSVMAAVESTFHGQFRVNYYSLSQDKDVGAGIAAARLRWRPTWDGSSNGTKDRLSAAMSWRGNGWRA